MRVGLTGLTMAEYFRDKGGKDVLLFIDNIFRFTQAGSEVSALLGRMPSAVGYQPTLQTEMGALQERITSTKNGSITSVQAVYVPADDLTDPAPATTFAHLDATTVLSRSIVELGIYPAVDPLESTSRILDPRIVGKEHYETARGVQEILQRYKELQDISSSQARNSYVQSIANSSDYVVSMQNEIATVQEHITECENYKAEMQSQKGSSEGTILNGYQSQAYAADKDLAQLTYQEAQEQYDAAKKGIVADFDGIVTECTGVSGASVTEGAQLITLESSQNVKVSFDASKSDVAKLAIGQKVDITISGNKYEGEISKINRMATLNASNTPMVGVEVHLTNPDDKIILGLDAKLTVHTNSAQDTLLIPVEAINADKNGDFLYVIENGMVVKRAITCGISSDEYTEVLDGITEEDQIIVNSLTGISLEEGMAVTAVPMEQ